MHATVVRTTKSREFIQHSQPALTSINQFQQKGCKCALWSSKYIRRIVKLYRCCQKSLFAKKTNMLTAIECSSTGTISFVKSSSCTRYSTLTFITSTTIHYVGKICSCVYKETRACTNLKCFLTRLSLLLLLLMLFNYY